MPAELLVIVTRGGLQENRHYGHIAVVDYNGKMIFSRGEPDYITYFRSAAKPIQAMEVIISGAYDRYNFSDKELSIMCASHYGEKTHRNTVKAILSKIGLNKDSLLCGKTTSLNSGYAIEMALQGYGPDVLFNDCSGKHAGFLAICKHKKYNLDDYIQLSHPLQQKISKRIASMCEYDPENIIHGTDGCGVPVHGMPISRMALGYAKLAKTDNLSAQESDSAKIITNAMATHPEMLSGTGGFCTALNAATRGRLFGKIGAEAVYCVGNQSNGQGLAIKLEDGNLWRLPPIVTKTLKDLNWLTNRELSTLSNFSKMPVKNKHNEVVGYTSAYRGNDSKQF